MKLYQVSDMLRTMRDEYDLDGIDLMLLGDFSSTYAVNNLGDGTTIMEFIGEFDGASQATTHARIMKLCEKNILKKVEVSDNLRYKTLEKGSEFDKLVKLLEKL